MDQLLNILAFSILIGTIAVIAAIRSVHFFRRTSNIMGKAQNSPWSLLDFMQLKPSRWKRYEYYRFVEEPVRSFAHRYNGRIDTAILHWEKVPILDFLIEYKFPINHIPTKMKDEDYFQLGLYSLALAESGVSCSTAKLSTVYCLQDVAKRCTQDKSKRMCWSCGEGRIFEKRFNPDNIEKHLKRLDEVWYQKRLPKAAPSVARCRPCPFSKSGNCNFSTV
ncbi:MAG: hypothetical protein ACFFDV_07520 [Candidatus Thorarchaeota archaeon]